MARVDGVHGPDRKPKIQFIDEWSELKEALKGLRESLDETPAGAVTVWALRSDVADLIDQVPRLMDAYAELWELMEGVIKAREQLEASKNDLYVPDAQEMVAGLANERRIRR